MIKIPETLNGDSYLTFNAQVPLVPRAIQVMVFGLAKEEGQLKAELQTILTSVDGKTNWLSDDERSERLGKIVGTAVGVLFGGGIVVLIKRRKSKAPSGG